jgi:hypothetical protein
MASTSPPIDLNLKLGRSERWAIAITSRLPEPLRENPERAMINTVAILLGIGGLIAAGRSNTIRLFVVWPTWVQVEWALAMLAGGVLALVGWWQGKSSASWTRLGMLFIAGGSFVYSISTIYYFGVAGAFTGAVFLVIGFAKLIRLIVDSAGRAARVDEYRHEHVPEESEDPPRGP